MEKSKPNRKGDDGGTVALRGFEFQKCSLLFYFLRRLERHPNPNVNAARMLVETFEDGTIEYATSEDSEIVFREFVQCKKREDKESDFRLPGYGKDSVDIGRFGPIDLQSWLASDRPVTETLARAAGVAYTALVLTQPADTIEPFRPFAVGKEELTAFDALWYRSDFNECFPFDFQHADDPADRLVNKKKRENIKNKYVPNDVVRKKVRVVALPAWEQLCFASEKILRDDHGIPPSRSYYALMELMREYDKRALATVRDEKIMTAAGVRALLSVYRAAQNKWTSGKTWLQQGVNVPSQRLRCPPLRWFDFHTGIYVHRPEFTEARQKLADHNFLVITGNPGAGKSTLARYLAYAMSVDLSAVYCLSVQPGLTLEAEKDFFLSNLRQNILFIIDDEQFLREECLQLIRLYTESGSQTRARLVVTTVDTYSPRMLSQLERQGDPLIQAEVIRLPLSETELEKFLDELRTKIDFGSSLASRDIAHIAHGQRTGQLGSAIALLSASSDLWHHKPSIQSLLESDALGERLRDWILACVGAEGQYETFDEHLAPLFILRDASIGHHGLYPEGIALLKCGGFLTSAQEVNSAQVRDSDRRVDSDQDGDGFTSLDLSLSILVAKCYGERVPAVFTTLFKARPSTLPEICRQLAYVKPLHKHIAAFYRRNHEAIASLLLDSAPLSHVTTVLSSFFDGDQGIGRELFYSIAKPGGSWNLNFFATFLRLERIDSPTSVARFFRTIIRIDRYLARKLADDEHVVLKGGGLRREHADAMWSRFCTDSAELDDVARAVREVFYCSRSAGQYLLERLNTSGAIKKHIGTAANKLQRLTLLLRYCTSLYARQRGVVGSLLNELFTRDQVVEFVRACARPISATAFLLQLRRLRPRVVSDAVAVIFNSEEQFLSGQLQRQDTLIAYSNLLSNIHTLNRRVARQLIVKTKGHLTHLVRNEHHYGHAAAELHNAIMRTAGLEFTQELCQSINENAILQSMCDEDYRVVDIGKSLATWAELDSELGSHLVARLDIEDFVPRILDAHLFNLSYLLHGFLLAAGGADGEARIRDAYLKGRLLPGAFREAWRKNRSLSQSAIFVLLLRARGMSPLELSSIVGCPSPARFEADILSLFRSEHSMLRVATALYQLISFSRSLANAALKQLLEHFTTDAASRTVKMKENNLVEIGSILRVAAAIDREAAVRLARQIEMRSFIDYSIEETNLGRLSVFVSGLHDASRSMSREFVTRISREDYWEYQLAENERLENALQWARVLMRVSRSFGAKFVHYLVEHHIDQICEHVESEANVMQVSNWLRTMASAGVVSMRAHAEQLSNTMMEATEYDSRLIHLLEATESMIEWGELDTARKFASVASKQSRQLRVLNLRDFVLVIQKALRIQESLGATEFTMQMLAAMDERHFQVKFLTESLESANNDPLLTAFAVYLHKNGGLQGLQRFDRPVQNVRDLLIARARRETHAISSAIILLLCEAQSEEIVEVASNSKWIVPWERGLAHALNRLIRPHDPKLFVEPVQSEINRWSTELPGVGAHAPNVEFGLCYHIARACQPSSAFVRDLEMEANERASDESLAVTRWLLINFNDQNIEHTTYHVWSLLRETVFRAAYLPWDQEVERSAREDAFRVKPKPHLEALLS